MELTAEQIEAAMAELRRRYPDRILNSVLIGTFADRVAAAVEAAHEGEGE